MCVSLYAITNTQPYTHIHTHRELLEEYEAYFLDFPHEILDVHTMKIHTYTHIQINIHTYTHTHRELLDEHEQYYLDLQTNNHTYIHTYIHTYTHTHTQGASRRIRAILP